jgi:hypothetical protein
MRDLAARSPIRSRQVHQPADGVADASPATAADAGTFVSQACPRHPPALAGLADHIGARDPDGVEEDLVEIGGARHLAQRANVDARASHVEDERRNARGAKHGFGARQKISVVGPLRPGAPHLLPGDQIVVAVAFGLGPQRGQIAAGLGFAEQLCPDVVAPRHRLQIRGPL